MALKFTECMVHWMVVIGGLVSYMDIADLEDGGKLIQSNYKSAGADMMSLMGRLGIAEFS